MPLPYSSRAFSSSALHASSIPLRPVVRIASSDWRAVVHTIKGAARGIGANALGDVCQTAEFGAPEDLPAVRAALDAAITEIAAYQTQRAA